MSDSESDFEHKVLNDFSLPDGRLKEIPRKLKKKLVIYRHIADQFEPGRHYSESEVNDVLQRFHPDYATIRRHLVDLRFMAREAGQYWRVEAAPSPPAHADSA